MAEVEFSSRVLLGLGLTIGIPPLVRRYKFEDCVRGRCLPTSKNLTCPPFCIALCIAVARTGPE